MLLQLRRLLHDRAGPVRIEELARELDTDTATVAALLDHACSRGWVVVDTDGTSTAGCAKACDAQSGSPRCRCCPIAR